MNGIVAKIKRNGLSYLKEILIKRYKAAAFTTALFKIKSNEALQNVHALQLVFL